MPLKLTFLFALISLANIPTTYADKPSTKVPLIFDTDIGNDCDDVLAMGVIHA